MTESIVAPPQASRTIEGLRDTGYEAADALEDIVDNSIAAGATQVMIRAWLDPNDELVIAIADNGVGMNREGLINAMTYGSRSRVNRASLGKFGLGLKTASTAMCRQLTVTSRSADDTTTRAAMWDLDFVQERNEWLLQLPEPAAEDIALLDEAAQGGTGTVVLWRKVDRLLPRSYKQVGATRKALDSRLSDFQEALELTYIRFLRGDSPHTKVQIVLNDVEIEPWDPFGEDIGSELLLDREIEAEIRNNGEAHTASFHVRAFALPPRSELSEDDSKRAAINVPNQGFYVFREGRLLAHGVWLGLRRPEPHLSLSRIELSFDHRLDDAFQLDLKKSRIHLQVDMQKALGDLTTPAIAEAITRYRKNRRSVAVKEQDDLHKNSNTIIRENEKSVGPVTATPSGPGKVIVKNARGAAEITIRVPDDGQEGGPFIVARSSIDDGLLWEPTIVEGKPSVALNVGHPFYERVYLANKENGTAIQGMDFLLWGLCQAEWAVMTESEREHMGAVRREVTRVTRLLANKLPEVDADALEQS